MLEKCRNEYRSDPSGGETIAAARSLCACWQELCEGYLPVISNSETWRYSREITGSDPTQGWKLHLSANVLTACEALRRVAPCLQQNRVLFKAPRSLQDLWRINCGLSYGYSQIGKFITIYPRSDEEAVALARRLHRLTCDLAAPIVPFDYQYRMGSCLYYRYGGFEHLDMETPEGRRIPAIRHPDGHLVPDRRDAMPPKPDWVADPFIGKTAGSKPEAVVSPLKTTFRVFRVLSQRGKGGVYQALDLSTSPGRLCILKEGRKGGEVGWDGRDGAWRAKNEERVLRSLQTAGVAAPRVYASFEVSGNYYLATEWIEGENLQTALLARRRRLSLSQVFRYGIRVSAILSNLHRAGWVWRDCKPGNLLLKKNGELIPIDFEGACPVAAPDPLPWNTPEFSPPESLEGSPLQSRIPEDLYALGATLYFLLTGRLLEAAASTPITELRRNAPGPLCDIISELLAPNPLHRPSAETAAERFSMAFLHDKKNYLESPAHRTRSANLGSDRRLSRNGSTSR